MLRKRLGKLGVATSAMSLAGLLISETSAAVPETLIPTILATVKTVAAGAATTGASSTAAMLAKGALKAMFIAKVKMVAAVAAVVVVTGAAVPVGIAVAQAVVYEKAGRTAAAVAAYRATLKNFPDAPEAALARSALDRMGSRVPAGAQEVP